MRMYRVFTIAALMLGLTACGASRTASWDQTPAAGAKEINKDAAAALEAEGDEAWTKRAEEAPLRVALEKWEKALEADPKNFQLMTKLARAYFFIGDYHLRFKEDTEGMKGFFEKGVAMGEKAMVSSSPAFEARVKAGEKPEEAVAAIPAAGQPAMYWYSVCLAKWGREQGFSTILKFKGRIYSIMKRVLELDPTYFYGAPHRYFGAYYSLAPGFAGGDMEKGREHFEKALEIAPDYIGTRVFFAEAWAEKEDEEEVWYEQLNAAMAADPNAIPDVAPENMFEQRKAKARLGMADDLW